MTPFTVNSSAALRAEKDFEQDFNNDGITGIPLSTTESAGSISLLKDSSGLAFANTADGSTHALRWKGLHIGDKTWKHWSVVGAESINGNNTIAMKKSSGKMELLHADSSWNATSLTPFTVNSSAALQAEKDFEQDFNNDQHLGIFNYEPNHFL